MAGSFEILCGVAAVLVGLYYYFTAKFDFWKERGVAGPQPIPVFGNIRKLMLGKQHLLSLLQNVYDEFKDEPMVGIFARRTPLLVLKDPDLIKDVLIKDFSKFADRGISVHEKTDPLSTHLFNLEPKRWRPLRVKLSPVFTSGKLKEMYGLILDCANHLEEYLGKLVDKHEPIEIRELTAQFTTDVIGSCAFGLEMNALSDQESEFRRMGRKIFKLNYMRLLKLRVRQSLPWLYDLLGYVLPKDELATFFTNSIKDTLEYRKKNNVVRNDFVNILIELKEHPEKLREIEVTDSLLTAQAFVFFAAGFETSSTTMSNALYELAQNHDIQNKLREEIEATYKKHDGDLSYEDIKGMSYLDQVFKETLRKYPPVVFLMRKSMEDYTFEGTKVSIPKNTAVWMPVYSIQNDPSLFADPKVFRPERFSDEEVQKRNSMLYLPFGDGPRNCIGARFAVYQSKLGLAKILRKYKVDVCEKTQIPYEIDPKSFILSPNGGIYLKVTKIDNK